METLKQEFGFLNNNLDLKPLNLSIIDEDKDNENEPRNIYKEKISEVFNMPKKVIKESSRWAMESKAFKQKITKK